LEIEEIWYGIHLSTVDIGTADNLAILFRHKPGVDPEKRTPTSENKQINQKQTEF